MKPPTKESFPEGTKFYIKEFDIPLIQTPEGSSVRWYNWLGGEQRDYDDSCLKLGNNWEAESFSEWRQLVKGSTPKEDVFRINEMLITSLYWILFIIIPSLFLAGVVNKYSLSYWVLAMGIVFLLLVGEHGLRVWVNFLKREKT